MYTIAEIFYSLQGEGRNTGMPVVFVRFAGCNLACPWCDTTHDATAALSVESVMAEVAKFDCRSVILTGGEPLVQHDLEALLRALKAAGYFVAIETNGTIEPSAEAWSLIDYVATSPKLDQLPRYDRGLISHASEVRLVVLDDTEATLTACEAMRGRIPAEDYFISPCDTAEGTRYAVAMRVLGQLNAARLSRSPWRLSIQAHKLAQIQ